MPHHPSFLSTRPLGAVRRAVSRCAPLSRHPDRAFVQAVRDHRLHAWAQRWPLFVPTEHDAIARVKNAAIHLTSVTFANVAHHPVRRVFADEPLMAWAIHRNDHAMLRMLAGEAWGTYTSLEHALLSVMPIMERGNVGMRHDASSLLATIADAHIARGEWYAYGQALAGALQHGWIGVVPWAIQQGLPVLDCLPVREHMIEVYNTGTSEACFRLAAFLGSAPSAHQRLRLYRALPLAGDTPSDVLFAPRPGFITACQELPLPRSIRSGRS